MARFLGPATAVVILNRTHRICHRKMGVTTADHIASYLRCVFGGIGLNLLRTTKEHLAFALGELGKVMGLVDLLEEVVDAVGDPGHKRIARDELIESVAV